MQESSMHILLNYTDLHVTAIDVHATDHAALCGHVRPVDHLLSVMIVQSHCVIEPLLTHKTVTVQQH